MVCMTILGLSPMADFADLLGRYEGRNQVQSGREEELTAAEKKRYLRGGEDLSLELRSDGTFVHKGVITGRFEIVSGQVKFTPSHFTGRSLQEMQRASAEMGRSFGLSFLFAPFSLAISDIGLVTQIDRSVIYTVYRKK